MERPAKHPRDIGVDRRYGVFIRKTRDRAGRVSPYAGKLPKRIRLVRNNSVMLPDDHPRQPVQVGRAPVVPESLPGLANLSGARPGEIVQGGEPREEAGEVLSDPSHLGLLQHHFRNENAIGVAGSAPGELAAFPAEPGQQTAPECRGGRPGWGGLRRHSSPR